MQDKNKIDLKFKIIEDFQYYFNNKYITPRDGNACVKLNENEYIITPSGVQKQGMKINHILSVNSEGKLLQSQEYKPSIELEGHLVAIKETGKTCSVHVHSINTVALFSLIEKKGLTANLEKYLMTEFPELFRYTKLGKTVHYLAPGSHELHESIKESFQDKSSDIIVLNRHGVISLGDDLEDCKEHILRLEHISEMVLKILSSSGGDLSILF